MNNLTFMESVIKRFVFYTRRLEFIPIQKIDEFQTFRGAVKLIALYFHHYFSRLQNILRSSINRDDYAFYILELPGSVGNLIPDGGNTAGTGGVFLNFFGKINHSPIAGDFYGINRHSGIN